MEALTNKPWAHAWPPSLDEFFAQRGYERAGRRYSLDFTRATDGKGEDLGERAHDEDGDDIRRLVREIMAHERDMGFNGTYTPNEDSNWVRVETSLDDVSDVDDAKEEDPTSERARTRRCANALLDMVDEDLYACEPALEMFERMDQNIDAFEAFIRDMRRRFDAGTLPKRDILGRAMLNRWRAIVASVVIVWIAISVAVMQWIVAIILAKWRQS